VWVLGIGDWELGPITNPQSPIPNIKCNLIYIKRNNNKYLKKINSIIFNIIIQKNIIEQ